MRDKAQLASLSSGAPPIAWEKRLGVAGKALFHPADGGEMLPTGKMVTYCGLGGEYPEMICSACAMVWAAPDASGEPDEVGTIAEIVRRLRAKISRLADDNIAKQKTISEKDALIGERNRMIQVTPPAAETMRGIRYASSKYGFEWGAAKIERLFSDEKEGWVTLGLTAPKTELQIYVTKTGKVRIHSADGREWRPEA
jgi:hypothetical protein